MRTLCLVLVGVVGGAITAEAFGPYVPPGMQGSLTAVAQDEPLGPGPRSDGRAETITVKLTPTPSSGEQRTGDQPGAATATTTVAEGVTPAPPQKGLVDLLGAAQISAGIDRYQLKVAGSGYYVIDSLTGRIWHGTGTMKPQLIAAELPRK